MGPSTWPGTEIPPCREDTLLQAARLRPFGVNYLQGAICPSLGLLAHLDGSSVHFFPYPPRDNPGELRGASIASIDLSPGTLASNPGGIDGHGVPRGGERGGGCPPVRVVARGLSWTQCSGPPLSTRPPVNVSAAAAAEAEAEAAVEAATAPVVSERLRAIGRGSHATEDVERDGDHSRDMLGEGGGGGGGKVSAHLAVACGSEVRLWKVSRASGLEGGPGEGGALEEGESVAGRQYRFSTVEVLTDWHRTIGGDCGGDAAAAAAAADAAAASGRSRHKGGRDGSDDEGKTASGDGGGALPKGMGFRACDDNVRCMSFRPGGGEGVGKPEREYKEEGVPLAVWQDTGAAVLGPGRKRATFPAPVAKKRACGAWSGCGRYLATSSGGEIRVHTNPSTLEAIGDVDAGVVNASAGQPARAAQAWVGSDSATTHAVAVSAADASEGTPAPWAKIVAETGPGVSGGDVRGNSFRTVLCVEAALCDGGSEGGGLSSPGSSTGGGSSSPSPRSTPSRRRGPSSGRYGLNDLTPPPSFAHMPSSAHEKGDKGRRGNANLLSNTDRPCKLPSKPSSSSKVLMGDMRAMCPAGPSAFFGTTGGGLGVGSLFGSGGGFEGSFAAVSTSDRRGGQDLLGAVVSDSVARIAASDITDAALSFREYSTPMQRSTDDDDGGGPDVEKHTRRGGFRHVLPGENWLAGSLRPRSRTPPAHPNLKVSHSSEDPLSSTQATRNAAGDAGDETNLAGVAEAHDTASANALDGGLSSGTSNPASACSLPLSASAPKVLDLRGKIGGIHAGEGGMAAAPGITSTHPLFRLSLGDRSNSALHTSSRSTTATPRLESVDVRGAGTRDVGGVTNVGGGGGGGESYGDTVDTPCRQPWLMRVSCSSRDPAGFSNDPSGAGSDSVRVKTLAALPLELASPDLLASNDDGNVVAVGSHASGLVACYRLTMRPVAGGRPAADEKNACFVGADSVGSANGMSAAASSGNAARGGGVRRRRHKRLAAPLCTLRLPSGYRAKGLAFAKDGSEGDGDGSFHRREGTDYAGTATRVAAAVGGSEGSGSLMSAADGASRGEGVAVLVLAGCTIAGPNNAVAQTRLSAMAKASPLVPRNLGKSAAESSYRTVLLRFSLPEIAAGGSDGTKRPPCFSPRSCTDERGSSMETSGMKSSSSPRNKDETPDVRLGSSDCLSRHGRRVGDSSKARARYDASVVGREGTGDGPGQLPSALAVDTGCASPAREQKTVARACRDGNQHGGGFGGDGGLLQDELIPLSHSGGRGRGTSASSALFGVDDGDYHGAVAGDALSMPGGARSACDQLVGGDDGDGRGAGSSTGRSQPASLFESAVLEGLADLERRMGERLDRIERVMLGMCDRVGGLERSLDGLSRGDPGKKREV